jgi:hypothetical protein
MKLRFLDRFGYPVTSIEGRPVTSFIRKLLWTRKIVLRPERSKFVPCPHGSPPTVHCDQCA